MESAPISRPLNAESEAPRPRDLTASVSNMTAGIEDKVIPNNLRPLFTELTKLGVDLTTQERNAIVDAQNERKKVGQKVVKVLETSLDEAIMAQEVEIYRKTKSQIEAELRAKLGSEKADAVALAHERSVIRDDVNSLAAYCKTLGVDLDLERRQLLVESLHQRYTTNGVEVFYNSDSSFVTREKFKDLLRRKQTADSHAVISVKSHFTSAEMEVINKYYNSVYRGMVYRYDTKRKTYQ